MVLDQSVMNVSISSLVDDFDTTVTTIQAVITLYCLVMAMLMLTGAQDRRHHRPPPGVRRSAWSSTPAARRMTAASQTVAVLALGWSILEGIGAALVLPGARRPDRRQLRGQGPQGRLRRHRRRRRCRHRGRPDPRRLGDDELSWRVVFVGEVVLVLGHPGHDPHDRRRPARPGAKPKLDGVGSVLSATGLGLVVLGVLQSSTWGWVEPKDSPIEPSASR